MGDVANNPKVDLYAVFGKDPQYYGTVGLAWVGGACRGGRVRGQSKPVWIGTSFNEYRNTASASAAVKIEYRNI